MSVTETLIECVKTRPILYDLKHPDHKNSKKKDKVWDEIGRVLNQDGEDLKKKWKNIKDCYQKYLKTLNPKNGQVFKRNYRNWQWAQQMEFCRPQAESAINDANNTNNIETQNERVNSPRLDANETSESMDENSLQDIALRFRNKRRKIVRELSAANTSLDYLQSRNRELSSFDATDLIFLGYSNTIKTFSPMRQAIVKMRIAQIVMEEEINNLKEKQKTVPSSRSPKLAQESGFCDDDQSCSSSSFSIKMEESDPY